MTVPPCATHTDLFDTALFDDDVSTADRTHAVHRAAALCSGCPMRGTCPQPVTHNTAPRPLTLLEPDWMPPAREGRPQEAPTVTRPRRPRRTVPPVGRDYVPPARRVTRWSAMAAELAEAGMPVSAIADRLCVTVDTARRLIIAAGEVAA